MGSHLGALGISSALSQKLTAMTKGVLFYSHPIQRVHSHIPRIGGAFLTLKPVLLITEE